MTEPLTHARIGYDSITKRATITASGAISGFPASAAANELTYSFWSAGLPATWQATIAKAESLNYFGVAAHTLQTNHAMVVMQAFLDAAWKTLPVLTTIGDLWRFDVNLYGERGAAPGSTFGNVRRGVAADGADIKPFLDAGGTDILGGRESKFGITSITVEPAITNIFPANVRNGGDTSEDLDGFDSGASNASYSTNRSVSGAGSILVTSGGGAAVLQTDPVAVTSSFPYAVQCKIFCPVEIGVVLLAIYGDVSGLIGFVQFDDVPAGSWLVIKHTETMAGGDSTAYATLTIDDDSCYVDELQLEAGIVGRTWINGSRAAGDLAYQPEIFQQIAGDITISFWIRSPSSTAFASFRRFFDARDTPSKNRIYAQRNVTNGPIQIITTDDDGNFQTLAHTYVWDDDWHMLTIVLQPGVSGAHNKLFYLDGVLVESVETTAIPTWSEIKTFDVGHVAGGSRIGADGQTLLDDLLVLNRAATATEILAWFDSGESADLASLGLPSHDDDRPIMRLVEETRSNKFRLRFVGQSTPVVGVIYMGKALEMARPIYGGHTPMNLARTTVVRPNVSERGQFLGRSIIRSGNRGSWSWTNLLAPWVRKYLDPFVESARTLPFFILWRPSSFPGESGYLWTLQDLAPSNSGGKDRMAFTLDAEGLGIE